MNVNAIEHKNLRVFLDPEKADQAPPDVKREFQLVDWAEVLHRNAMLIAAAGVLEAEGSLEKAASVLSWAGFEVPAGYFPEGYEGDLYLRYEEKALQMWVEQEAERIEEALGTLGFRLVAVGSLMKKADPYREELDTDG